MRSTSALFPPQGLINAAMNWIFNSTNNFPSWKCDATMKLLRQRTQSLWITWITWLNDHFIVTFQHQQPALAENKTAKHKKKRSCNKHQTASNPINSNKHQIDQSGREKIKCNRWQLNEIKQTQLISWRVFVLTENEASRRYDNNNKNSEQNSKTTRSTTATQNGGIENNAIWNNQWGPTIRIIESFWEFPKEEIDETSRRWFQGGSQPRILHMTSMAKWHTTKNRWQPHSQSNAKLLFLTEPFQFCWSSRFNAIKYHNTAMRHIRLQLISLLS